MESKTIFAVLFFSDIHCRRDTTLRNRCRRFKYNAQFTPRQVSSNFRALFSPSLYSQVEDSVLNGVLSRVTKLGLGL